jgi:hypothetical protein
MPAEQKHSLAILVGMAGVVVLIIVSLALAAWDAGSFYDSNRLEALVQQANPPSHEFD